MKIYVDTSVFGGIFDTEFLEHSELFFELVEAGHITLVTSYLVESEILKAPRRVQDAYIASRLTAEFAVLTDAALELGQAYLDANIITPKWRDDATHVALASVSRCDIIASWNFKHIVDEKKFLSTML